MNLPREDVYCPACPNPETAFRLEDVGMKVATDTGPFGDTLRFTMSRPAWEPVMLEHLRSRLDDAEHRRVYDLCVTTLMEAERSAEDSARDAAQGTADWLRRSITQEKR